MTTHESTELGGDRDAVGPRQLGQVPDGGPCRARTDDIHGVNVALYQLS
jgi:hypothetical protein